MKTRSGVLWKMFHFYIPNPQICRPTPTFPPPSIVLTSPSLTTLNYRPLINHSRRRALSTATNVEDDKDHTHNHWLLKTEPGEWSWDDQAANGGVSQWDGVKNKQAQKHMKSMKRGDLCFFYHSGPKARRVVGVVSVVKEWYLNGGDGVVDVRAVGKMRRAVDLKEMKGDDGLKGFALFKQSRLSVVPVPKRLWERVCEIGGGFEAEE